jgi:glyoxalase family protein
VVKVSAQSHHIAFDTTHDSQKSGCEILTSKTMLNASAGQYFHSIYFREPGGVLFEVATKLPEFIMMETVENLRRL